jgi:hypothetical protein
MGSQMRRELGVQIRLVLSCFLKMATAKLVYFHGGKNIADRFFYLFITLLFMQLTFHPTCIACIFCVQLFDFILFYFK